MESRDQVVVCDYHWNQKFDTWNQFEMRENIYIELQTVRNGEIEILYFDD